MPRPIASLLLDARAGPPGPLPETPDVEVIVAGPGQAIDLPADTPEAVLFHALVDAATAPLCVWQQASDVPIPGRISVLQHALVTLKVPVVGHRGPRYTGRSTGRVLRLPGPQVTSGTLVPPATLAFRREVAAFAPSVDQFRHGTRRALLSWAAVRDGVGFVDRVLLQRPPVPQAPLDVRLEQEVIATQASYAALATLQALEAPQPLMAPAIQHLLDRSQTWTWTHWDLLMAHKRPTWLPPPTEGA